MADFGQSLQVRNVFLRLFHFCSVNLNAVSCLTEAVKHHRFCLQQEYLTETEYRKRQSKPTHMYFSFALVMLIGWLVVLGLTAL